MGVTLFAMVDASGAAGLRRDRRVRTVVENRAGRDGHDAFRDRLGSGACGADPRIRTAARRRKPRAAPPTGSDTCKVTRRSAHAGVDGIINWETRARSVYDWVRAPDARVSGRVPRSSATRKFVVWRARPVELVGGARAGTSSSSIESGQPGSGLPQKHCLPPQGGRSRAAAGSMRTRLG